MKVTSIIPCLLAGIAAASLAACVATPTSNDVADNKPACGRSPVSTGSNISRHDCDSSVNVTQSDIGTVTDRINAQRGPVTPPNSH